MKYEITITSYRVDRVSFRCSTLNTALERFADVLLWTSEDELCSNYTLTLKDVSNNKVIAAYDTDGINHE